MSIRRYELSSTSKNLEVLSALVRDPRTKAIRLFASERQLGEVTKRLAHVTWTNLPLVSALVEFEIPGFGTDYLVFDGDFLTAVRPPRAQEVSSLLDRAIEAGNVCFGTQAAPFTSDLSPEAAMEELASVPTVQLTAETRSAYWQRLSALPEGSY